jgi:flagellar biosynthesis protein FliR
MLNKILLLEMKGREVFVNMVRKVYANFGVNFRSNRKTFELTSMVNKKPITTILQEFSLFLMLPTKGHDVYIEKWSYEYRYDLNIK